MLEKIKDATKNFMFWVEGVFWKSQRFLMRLVQRKK